MKNLKDIITEKLRIGKDIKIYKYIADIKGNNSKETSVWILYSPIFTKPTAKPKFYKGTFNKHGENQFSVCGPYITSGKQNICLVADFEKGIQYDDNSLIAATKLNHGYVFVARVKDYLMELANPDNMFKIKTKFGNPSYVGKFKNDIDPDIKTYLEQNIIQDI